MVQYDFMGINDLELSSDAFFERELKTDEVYLNATSDSDINLIGTANMLNAKLSSDSRLRNYGFQVEDLKISLTSDSRLFYKCDVAIVYVDLSGESKVVKK